ncbi:MAG: helix-turn-helix domain-containing protein [Niastella sp.]|nr:helix-turn-helix domain-containing protein [Niastella sp.]
MPSFNIQRLKEAAETGAEEIRGDVTEIFLVMNGVVAIEGRREDVLLAGNTLYFTGRDEYNHAAIRKGTEGYIIRFSKALLYYGDQEFYCSHFATFHTLILKGTAVQVAPSFWEEGKKLCEMICQELENNSDYKMQVLSGMLGILLLHLMRTSNADVCNTGSGNKNVLVHRFNALIEQKFRSNRKVSDYATMLLVTPNYLNEIIKQVTGKSAGFHIRQRVALEAIRQAKLTGASMKEVAWQLGFNDNAHFSKFFKKVAGRNFSDINK